MFPFSVRPLTPEDRPWVRQFWNEHWGAEWMVVHGEVFYVDDLPGFVAEQARRLMGLATYRISDQLCELISLDSLVQRQGIGAVLIEAVVAAAYLAGCRRFVVTTTNDNLNALRFYQKRGFHLACLRPGAVNASRWIKPSIPEIGEFGIPLRDEIELEKDL